MSLNPPRWAFKRTRLEQMVLQKCFYQDLQAQKKQQNKKALQTQRFVAARLQVTSRDVTRVRRRVSKWIFSGVELFKGAHQRRVRPFSPRGFLIRLYAHMPIANMLPLHVPLVFF